MSSTTCLGPFRQFNIFFGFPAFSCRRPRQQPTCYPRLSLAPSHVKIAVACKTNRRPPGARLYRALRHSGYARLLLSLPWAPTNPKQAGSPDRSPRRARVFSVAIIATVPNSIAVSKLPRPFLSDSFIAVRLLRRREKFTEPGFALLARAFNRARALHPFYLTTWVFLPDHPRVFGGVGVP